MTALPAIAGGIGALGSQEAAMVLPLFLLSLTLVGLLFAIFAFATRGDDELGRDGWPLVAAVLLFGLVGSLGMLGLLG